MSYTKIVSMANVLQGGGIFDMVIRLFKSVSNGSIISMQFSKDKAGTNIAELPCIQFRLNGLKSR